jgi:GNAT superfamily N-acetyltransferase
MRAAMDQPDAVAIRPVRAADLDPIAALQEASIMRLGLAAYGEAKARAWARVGYDFKHVLLGDGGFFVAEQAGRTIGVGGWSPDSLEAGLAWIRYLFVHPDAAGRGIGRRLVEVAEASAQSAGRHRFDVWSSLNAVGFYEALGYRRVRAARWPVAAGTELDYVLMSKRGNTGAPAPGTGA